MDIKDKMLQIEQLINCGEECFAHISEDGKEKETLNEHTKRSQKYWLRIAENKKLDIIMESL